MDRDKHNPLESCMCVVCMFITVGPIYKAVRGEEEAEDGGHVL